MSLTISQSLKVVLVIFAIYFPVALYLRYDYIPQPDPPKAAILTGPFLKLDDTAYQAAAPKIDAYADVDWGPTRSTVVLSEDGKPLGPGHSPRNVANGRYSHWRGYGIIFSASDNSNPNTNGRIYSVTWK